MNFGSLRFPVPQRSTTVVPHRTSSSELSFPHTLVHFAVAAAGIAHFSHAGTAKVTSGFAREHTRFVSTI